MWRVDTKVQDKTWTVIEYPGFSVVVPSADSRSHVLQSLTCPCNTRVEYQDGHLIVVHKSWREQKAINNSMKKTLA